MEIQIGKYAGFCMGAQRAVDMVLKISANENGTPISTFGPLIHNSQVMNLLAQKGITTLSEIPEKGSGIAVIRAHGVQPGVKQRLQQAGFEVVDATCPRVVHIQDIIQTHSARGFASIIVGDRTHPEIEGLLGYAAGGKGHVVETLEEIQALPAFGQAVVVAQSTQDVALYRKVRQWVAENHPHYQVFDTICDSTERRQAEIVGLAGNVDLLLVVGDRNSGNTRRLYEVASTTGKPAILIETEKDLELLDREMIAFAGRIGITAGASTPDWVVREVRRELKNIGRSVAGGHTARGKSIGIAEVEEELLEGVSRSFALTIPQLPAGLRERVTNAYLLCRIVDTIEDEETLPIEAKRDFFHEFIVLLGKGDIPSVIAFANRLLPLLSGSTLPAEKELVRKACLVLQSFFAMTDRQREILARCLRIMSVGMLRFQESKSSAGLPTLTDMNAYCYHVAGVVGEMLTELFSDYSSEIAAGRDSLLALAPSFGQGLQMTNILKDIWEDRERGACWLPRDIFLENGFDLHDLGRSPYVPGFGAGLAELVAITHGHLRNALDYTLLIPKKETGIRKFCLWGIGMAVLTLRNIHRLPQYTDFEQIKITRREVKKVVLISNMWVKNDFMLKKAFRIAGRGLPMREAKPGARCSVWHAPEGASLLYQEM